MTTVSGDELVTAEVTSQNSVGEMKEEGCASDHKIDRLVSALATMGDFAQYEQVYNMYNYVLLGLFFSYLGEISLDSYLSFTYRLSYSPGSSGLNSLFVI